MEENKNMTDFSAQIGEADTWLDKAKTLVRQNKLAAFSALLIILMILIAIFAPVVAPYDHLQPTGLEPTSWGVMCSAVSFFAHAFP